MIIKYVVGIIKSVKIMLFIMFFSMGVVMDFMILEFVLWLYMIGMSEVKMLKKVISLGFILSIVLCMMAFFKVVLFCFFKGVLMNF